MRYLIVGLLLILVMNACRFGESSRKDEGVITYKIVYPEEVQKRGFAAFLPTKMISTFKGKDYKVSIKGDLSLYQLDYISKANGDSTTTLFRIFDKRMYHEHGEDENLFLFERVDETRLEFIKNETKTIAGVECQKAIVHFSNPDLQNITVYYTSEIRTNRPKENSPFDDIPGALMEFKLNFKGLELKCVAVDVDMKKVNTKSFLVPKNYTSSKQGEIDELVSSLLQ
jgi:GLPGLI family protein